MTHATAVKTNCTGCWTLIKRMRFPISTTLTRIGWTVLLTDLSLKRLVIQLNLGRTSARSKTELHDHECFDLPNPGVDDADQSRSFGVHRHHDGVFWAFTSEMPAAMTHITSSNIAPERSIDTPVIHLAFFTMTAT